MGFRAGRSGVGQGACGSGARGRLRLAGRLSWRGAEKGLSAQHIAWGCVRGAFLPLTSLGDVKGRRARFGKGWVRFLTNLLHQASREAG